MDAATRNALLSLYDAPDPAHPGRLIPGYDRDHAERATRILLLVVPRLGVGHERLAGLEVAGLLHDLGRAGMDPALFSRIFNIAEAHGLPVRPRALRQRYPQVTEATATDFFLSLAAPLLAADGLVVDDRVCDHVRMRMDFKGRFRERLAEAGGVLRSLFIEFEPWMEKVVLYYYYPEDMAGQPADVRTMGMAQVACENFEAFNNAKRGRDYYGRTQERLADVFSGLARFEREGLVTPTVIARLKRAAASGELDAIIRECRGMPPGAALPAEDREYQRSIG